MDFTECLFYSEDRHGVRSTPLNGSNEWIFKENAGAACQECTIIWQPIYKESGKPGVVDRGGVWFPPPREDVDLWSNDYYLPVGKAGTEDEEDNSSSPPREAVKPPAPAPSSSSHQTPSQSLLPSSAHQLAPGSVNASSRIPAPSEQYYDYRAPASGYQAQPAGSTNRGRSMLDPPVASSPSQAAGSMTSGSQAPAPAPGPPIQVERTWCDQCRDSAIVGWGDGRCNGKDPCSRCIMFGQPCTNDLDPRQGIRPFCDRCRGGAHRDCDKGYPSCGHCEREGAECRYNPAINGRAPR